MSEVLTLYNRRGYLSEQMPLIELRVSYSKNAPRRHALSMIKLKLSDLYPGATFTIVRGSDADGSWTADDHARYVRGILAN